MKGEFERRKANRISGVAQEPQDETDSLDTLSQVLDSVGQSSADSEFSAANRLAIRLKTLPKVSRIVAAEKVTEQSEQNAANSTYTVSYAPQYQEDYAISKVSDFDSRLTLIEAALGIDAIPLPTQDRTNSKAVIPTLDSLDKQLVTLSTSTESSLDKVSRRVRQLTQDAEKLEQARRAAKAAQEALSPADDDPPWLNTGAKDVEISEDTEQRAKINALYGTLTTIESLAPLLPSVLDRLRSLRSLHADAATASQTLAEVQSRQEDMRQELQGWREGLEKVEKAMEHGEQTMKENTRTVEGWVKELEERLQKLGS